MYVMALHANTILIEEDTPFLRPSNICDSLTVFIESLST